MMSPASVFILASIWLIMFWCNRLMPPVGDDFLYSYIIDEDTIFYNFVPDTAVRVNSIADICISQWNHYFLWGGRTIAHTLDQFWLLIGELPFDIANAFIAVLLVVEIYWAVDRGRISTDFKVGRLIWIFAALWLFTVNFGSTFLWTTGACNYLWTTVILLAFVIPYIRQWFSDRPLEINSRLMLIAGVIAGWTNENTVCWFIIAIALMCKKLRAESRMSRWMIAGLIGFSIGYALLIFAPGNFARAELNTEHARAIIFEDTFKAGSLLGIGMWFQLVMWYFFVRTLIAQKKFGDSVDVRRSLIAAKTFALISLSSNLIMLLSPELAVRSFFPSLVYLIIAVTIVIRIQHETKRNALDLSLRIFLHSVGAIAFAFSVCATFMYMSAFNNYLWQVERFIERNGDSEKILDVPDFDYPDWLDTPAVSHTPSNFLARRDGKDIWVNKVYAHYHGIKGIWIADDAPDEDSDDVHSD